MGKEHRVLAGAPIGVGGASVDGGRHWALAVGAGVG
jgi:hypothetical protein